MATASMKDYTLTLHREGRVSVRWTESNSNQCGNLLADILNYWIEITVKGETLDEQGFIIDNMAVYEFMRNLLNTVTVFESCELIAVKVAEHFRCVLGDDLLAISVTIAGVPEARMTCKWERVR